MSRTCTVNGCDRKHRARGWCHMHYERWWRGGGVTGLQPHSMVMLDAAPVVALVRSTDRPVVRLLHRDALRRAYYRALRSGRIGDLHADRIAVVCGRTLDELYGPCWDDGVAA